MCCESSGYSESDINGVCPECGADTCYGSAFDCCGYSPCQCNHCGSAPCDGSC